MLSTMRTSLSEAIYGNAVYNQLLAALKENPLKTLTTDRAKFIALNQTNPNAAMKQTIDDFFTLSSPEESKEDMEKVAIRSNNNPNKMEPLEYALHKAVTNNTNNHIRLFAEETSYRMALRGSVASFGLARHRQYKPFQDKIHNAAMFEKLPDFAEFTILYVVLAVEYPGSFKPGAIADLERFSDQAGQEKIWQRIYDTGSAAYRHASQLQLAKSAFENNQFADSAAHYLALARDIKGIAGKLIFYNRIFEMMDKLPEKLNLRILAEVVKDVRLLTEEKAAKKLPAGEYESHESVKEREDLNASYQKYKKYLDDKLAPYKAIVEKRYKAVCEKRKALEGNHPQTASRLT